MAKMNFIFFSPRLSYNSNRNVYCLNFLIYKKENILKSGKTVLLKLAPRDPRSLIQGDFMSLRYDLPTKINETLIPEEDVIGMGMLIEIN